MKFYLYDCDMGQGSVTASSLEEAREKAVREAGSANGVRNVRLPTDIEIAARKSFGGRMD